MSPRIIQILQAYKTLAMTTGQTQPMMKMASFLSPEEAMAMAEFGCEHATIPVNILAALANLEAEANPPPPYKSEGTGVPAARLAHLASTDPLAGDAWDGKVASVEVDYLANGGEELQQAIEADPMTKKGLKEALDLFQECERKSRAAIEAALKEI